MDQNLLRKALYYNYDYYHALGRGAFVNEDQIVKSHVSKYNLTSRSDSRYPTNLLKAHCLDILRQQLMCTVDVGVLGQVWWDPEEPKAFVDFNTKHVCRNFEDVRKWAEARQLPEKAPSDYLQPPKPGQYITPAIP
jgi:hypothetical protein